MKRLVSFLNNLFIYPLLFITYYAVIGIAKLLYGFSEKKDTTRSTWSVMDIPDSEEYFLSEY